MDRYDAPVRIAPLIAAFCLGVSALLAGCSGSEPQVAEEPVVVPDGYAEKTCGLPPPDPVTTATIAVPREAVRNRDLGEVEENDEKTCEWLLPAPETRFFDGITVAMATTSLLEQESLQDLRDELAPRVGQSGDEEVWDLELTEDVPVFGVTGDRLSWRCACDGVGGTFVQAQADGVRVTLSGADEVVDEIDAYAEAILPLVRVER